MYRAKSGIPLGLQIIGLISTLAFINDMVLPPGLATLPAVAVNAALVLLWAWAVIRGRRRQSQLFTATQRDGVVLAKPPHDWRCYSWTAIRSAKYAWWRWSVAIIGLRGEILAKRTIEELGGKKAAVRFAHAVNARAASNQDPDDNLDVP